MTTTINTNKQIEKFFGIERRELIYKISFHNNLQENKYGIILTDIKTNISIMFCGLGNIIGVGKTMTFKYSISDNVTVEGDNPITISGKVPYYNSDYEYDRDDNEDGDMENYNEDEMFDYIENVSDNYIIIDGTEIWLDPKDVGKYLHVEILNT